MLCIAGFDGYFKRLNPAFQRTLGFTLEEMLGKPYIDFVHPDDRDVTRAEAGRIATGEETVSFENRYLCKDGSYKWMLWTAAPDSERRIIYSAARDITERKRAEEALRESEERYRSVIAAMQEGIVLLDGAGGIRACNASAERILGLPAEQIIGRTPFDPRWQALHEDRSPFPAEAFPAAVTLRTAQPCSNVVMGIRKPDGILSWICINSRPLLQPSGISLAGVVVSFSDITDRKLIEEELRSARAELERARVQSASLRSQ